MFFAIRRSLTNCFAALFCGFLFLAVSLYIPLSLFAQTPYTLYGQVLDRDKWLPLYRVQVGIPNRPITTHTDSAGNFSLSDTLPIINLSFSLKKYYDKDIQVAPDAERIITYLQREIGGGNPSNSHLPYLPDELYDPTRTDTLPTAEITAQGFGSEQKLLQTAGAVSIITPRIIERDNEGSLLPALNTVAGLRVEERSPGSYRIAVRGSNLLRSPFGVRNLKTYWNDIPLTDARGTTPINLLDLRHIGTIEIIKGPAGSVYGAGNGGVLLLRQKTATLAQNSAEVGMSVCNFGLLRYDQSVELGTNRAAIAVQYARHQTDGYRQHTTFDRDILSANARLYMGKGHSLMPFVCYTDLYYEIPGGLTLEERDTDPRQARSDFIAQNASVSQQTLIGGLAYRYQNPQWLVGVALSGSHTDFDNPFTTNYKTETATAFNSRATLTYRTALGKIADMRSTVGGEWQWSSIEAGNFGNIAGKKDTLNFADDIVPMQYLAFAQTEFDFPRQWTATFAVSHSRLRYNLSRTVPNDVVSTDTLTFRGLWSPRVALVKSWGKRWAMHGSISYGFSPPVLDEIRTANGAINRNLNAERGINYEVGIRANLAANRLFADLCGYWLHITDAMVRYTTDNGTVLFQNAGATDNRGIELMLRYQWLPVGDNGAFRNLDTWVSYTYSNYVFSQYTDKGVDYSGNPLTGTPPHLAVVGIDAALRMGIYAHLSYTYTDSIPLNDGHTVLAEPFHLLKSRIGYRYTIGRLRLDAYVNADNLLNEVYSLGNDLNAFGNRYYQPAASRNVGAGLRLGLGF